MRNYQQQTTWSKWRKFTVNMRELGRKDSLIGAQLVLKGFSEKLKMFDVALEKLYHDKVGH